MLRQLIAGEHGNLMVMELNPLPGLHPWHSDLPMLCTAVGVPYVELIDRIITSAKQRVVPVQKRVARSAAAASA